MDARVSVTQDEILQAIRDAIATLPENEGPVGITTTEMIKATGRNEHAVRADIVRLLRAGTLERVKVYRVSELSGARCKVPGFRPK